MHAYRHRNDIPLDAPLMRSPNGTRSPCIIEGCIRPRKGRDGYCEGHARRHKSGGEMTPEFEPRMKQPEQCSFDGCTGQPQSKGYCAAHYRQLRVDGTLVELRKPTVWDICTYSAAHHRCRQLWGRVQQYPCVECGEPADDWAYDGTDSTALRRTDDPVSVRTGLPYSRFPEFYMPLCKTCHKRRDMGVIRRKFAPLRQWRKRTRSGGDDEPPF
jgi:hypothetical protein